MGCVVIRTLSKTTLKFGKYIFKISYNCLLEIFSNILEIVGRILTGLQFPFWFFPPFFETDVIVSMKKETLIKELRLVKEHMKIFCKKCQRFLSKLLQVCHYLWQPFLIKSLNLINNIFLPYDAKSEIIVWESFVYCRNTWIFTILENRL